MSRTYRVTHRTRCVHHSRATAAWQIVRLRPREEPLQECLEFELETSPRPAETAERRDCFGNTLHFFNLREPHHEMTVSGLSVVRRHEPALPMAGLTPALAKAREAIDLAVNAGDFELEQYRHASPRIPLLVQARELAEGIGTDEEPVLDWIGSLGARFKERFTFDATATRVSTPIASVLEDGRGVCQDFAHLFICCARQHGIPAAYVSGYLLTKPPPGSERLTGADASHAWVSLFVPGTGWVDYDPTNHLFVGDEHIAVARGRDYGDVSPTRGVYSGGGAHRLLVSVTVESVAPSPLP